MFLVPTLPAVIINLCSTAPGAAPGNSAAPTMPSTPCIFCLYLWVHPAAVVFPIAIYSLGLGPSSTSKLRVHVSVVSHPNTVKEWQCHTPNSL